MESGKEVTIQSESMEIITQPEIILANAKVAAKALIEVISMKKKPVIFNGEQYLEFEDWQTCGQFYGYTVKTGDAVPVNIDGVKGAKAHADLISLKTGEIIGGADAFCMRDEEKWNTRPKYEWQGEGDKRQKVKIADEPVPWFQLASMAQTRAGAKAFRNRLAWVVVLAGYKPTPAEEMTGAEETGRQPDQSQSKYFCQEHKTVWFKSGKMENYAHPIKGTEPTKWCNMPKPPEAKITMTSDSEPPEEPPDEKPADINQKRQELLKALNARWPVYGVPPAKIKENQTARVKFLVDATGCKFEDLNEPGIDKALKALEPKAPEGQQPKLE